MRQDGGRRLTGRNLLTLLPGCAVEVTFDDDDRSDEESAADQFVSRFRAELATALVTLALPLSEPVVRRHAKGLSLAVTLPEDALYTGSDALEWAAARAVGEPRALDELDALRAALGTERNPELVALLEEAKTRDVPAFADDEFLTLGFGSHSITYPVRDLPRAAEIDWSMLGRIPVALVTGTNGKTTTTRMIVRMLECAGLVVGYSSTDALVIGGSVIDAGDWSGPGGARMVLRDPRVGAAVLETARGGLLRRGLAVTGVDVAAVTNVGDDHFGDYGIVDLTAMAEVKTLVGHAVRKDGTVVLNGADPELHRYRDLFVAPVTWFAVDKAQCPDAAWFVDDGHLMFRESRVIAVNDIPLAFGGAARHNVENALCAAAVAHGLGLALEAIQNGLRTLTADDENSPGRTNIKEKDGVRLLLDFAHNPAGVDATLAFVHALREQHPGGRLILLTGQAGDRSDEEIRALARSIMTGAPDRVVVRELTAYLRGREPFEARAVLAAALTDAGLPAVDLVDTDVDGLDFALSLARPGDFIAYLVLIDREQVQTRLRDLGW